MIGHQNLKKQFIKIADTGHLSHGYMFFGDEAIGKFGFAVSLAGYLEFGEFTTPKRALSECLVIKPIIEETKESIGIDQIREIRNFLYQVPINSKYRVVIIDDAHYLTDHAQSAILKIAEEPPAHGVIIMVLPNPESIIKTLQSRLQKIYFTRVDVMEIAEWLAGENALNKSEAQEIAKASFGRPGFAKELASGTDRMREEARRLVSGVSNWRGVSKDLADVENRRNIYPFLKFVIAELSKDPVKNVQALRALSARLSAMSETSANKRLQLESALYPVQKG